MTEYVVKVNGVQVGTVWAFNHEHATKLAKQRFRKRNLSVEEK